MPVFLRQQARVGAYLLRNKLRGRERYPLIVELEPLFACNLSCNGCGKIQHPTDILRKRLSVDDIVGAVQESGTPMVSIAGGEPLLDAALPEFERTLIRVALARSDGRRQDAAKVLGWGRNTLTRKMRELGMGRGPLDDEVTAA